MTNEEIADKLVKGFKAYLAQRALDADPAAIRESNLFQVVGDQHRAELVRLTEQKLRASLQDDLANSFEGFRK
jgi:hypothetical protein